MSLGVMLKICRTNKGLSQEKVAELIGVSRQAVTKWESNQTSPSSNNLIELASIYDISVDELVAGKQNKQKRDHKILHTNLTLIAIISQAAFLNVAMQPLQPSEVLSLKISELAVKLVPLFASSVWMTYNLRYEKNYIQHRKNTKIELLYCLIQLVVMLFGYFSKLYFIGTLLLSAVVLFYIFFINPKYMNRRLTRANQKYK